MTAWGDRGPAPTCWGLCGDRAPAPHCGDPDASCPLPSPKDGFNNEQGSITGIIGEVTAAWEPSPAVMPEPAQDVLFLDQ